MLRRLCVSVTVILLCAGGPLWAQPDKVTTHVEKLESKKKATRLEALRQLGKHGTAAKDAADAVGMVFFKAEDADEVAQAAATLAQLGPAGVPVLLKAFKDARAQHAQEAAKALARMGPAAGKAVPALIEALRDPDPTVRGFAALALGETGDFSEEVTFALFGRVADPTINVRLMAGKALVRAGPKAAPGLRTILKEGASPARVEAAGLLGMMGTDGSDAVAELLSCLEDDVPQLRGASALALGRIGTNAKEVMPTLLRGLVKEKSPCVQECIFQSVLTLGNKDMPGFMDELRKINGEHGWAGPFILAKFGPRGVDAVKPLVKLLTDKDTGMRLAAVLALGQIGPEAAESLPAVHVLMRDPNPLLRAAASQSLARIDPRQAAVGLNQFLVALKQTEHELLSVESKFMMGVLLKPTEGSLRKSFADPVIQAFAARVVHQRLMVSAATNKQAPPIPSLKDADKTSADLIQKLGPEAIPALADGIRRAEEMKLGFC